MTNEQKICKLLNINVISDLYQRFSIHSAGEIGKGASGRADLESNGERPPDVPRLSSPNGEMPRDEPRLPSPNGQTPGTNPAFPAPTGRCRGRILPFQPQRGEAA